MESKKLKILERSQELHLIEARSDKKYFSQGCGVGVVGFRVESHSLQHWESESDFFYPTRMSNWIVFLYHTPKLGIPLEMVQFLLKQISCCAPRFPLSLTAKLHSLYVKESEILERWDRVGVGYFSSDSTALISLVPTKD